MVKMKKSIVLAITVVILVSAAILGCSNSKASSRDYNNTIVYEDKDIKVYLIETNSNRRNVIVFSKMSGDIDVCR